MSGLDCALLIGPMCFREMGDFYAMLGTVMGVVGVMVLGVLLDRRLRAKRQRTDDEVS